MAINRKQTVDIVEDLVTLINTELTGTSAWVDNGDGTYTITLCNTYWLNTMETVTIDSVEFTDLVVVKDTSLTVTGASIPTAITFFLDVPSYYHGTVIQTNEEITASSPNVTARTPMVYLLEIISDDFKSDEDSLERTSDLRLFFLTEADEKNWKTDTHYTDAIDPMRKMVSFFVDEVLKKSKGLGKIEEYTVTNHANFGVYTTDKGHTKKIFNDSYSGCELRITLPIKADMSCGCDGVFSKIKYVDSDSTIQSSDYGSTIVCTPCSGGLDGTAVAKDSDSNILSTTTIPSGTTVDIPISNSTLNVNKSDATLISSETILAEGTSSYNVADSTVKSTGVVYTSTVKATETFTIPDVAWTDSDSTPKTSEYGAAITCAASVINTTGAQTLHTGQVVSYATNDDASRDFGRDVSHYILSWNNYFGHTQRFTSTIGGYYDQTLAGYYDVNGVASSYAIEFADDIVIDWATFVEKTGAVQFYVYSANTTLASGTWAVLMAATPLTHSIYSDWYVFNVKQSVDLADTGMIRWLNWSPLLANNNLVTSSTNPNNTAQAYMLATTALLTSVSKTNARQTVFYRLGNTSEL
jgi:hypothetical protein